MQTQKEYLGFIAIHGHGGVDWVYLDFALSHPPQEQDTFFEGDHDYYGLIAVENLDDLNSASNYSGHGWVKVQSLAEQKIKDLFPKHIFKQDLMDGEPVINDGDWFVYLTPGRGGFSVCRGLDHVSDIPVLSVSWLASVIGCQSWDIELPNLN